MRNQRNICRGAFVLLGILPLLATLVYAGWRNHRWDAAHFADLCGRSFGCRATVREADFIRPGVLRLVGVELSDPETGQVLLHCDVIDVQHQEGTLRLNIPNVEIAHAGDQILYAIHERVLCQPDLLQEEVIVAIENLRFDQAAESHFANTEIELRRIENGTELRAAFYPLGVSAPIDLTIRRTWADSSHTTVVLETRDYELPIRLLVGPRNWLPRLTSTATFRGNIWCDLDADGWTWEIVGGRLRNIDLDRFLGKHFGGWIRGTADFVVTRAKFQQDVLQTLEADVFCTAGQIGMPRLSTAISVWHLAWNEQPALNADFADVQQLACGVDLEAGRLALRGRAEPTGTMLILTTGERLSTDPAHEVHAPLSILEVLFPGQSSPSLVSAEAEWLLRVLPLPSTQQIP